MTQEELGEAIWLNKSTIQRYENGIITQIKIPVLNALASALSVTPEWIIGQEEKEVKTMLILRELREEKGLSMRQLATELEISYNVYRSYEVGDREPDIETLIKMADFFECTVDLLIGRKSKPPALSLKPKQYENTSVFAVQSVRMRKVIETVTPLGLGHPGDPARDIVQYWDLDGNLLGEIEKNK